MNRLDNIFLLGFMGSGKSILAPRLAKRLGYVSIDLDQEIVRATGKSIARLFTEEGETVFRKLESNTLVPICAAKYQVCALGGGTLSIPQNQSLVQQSGIRIYLSCSAQTIYERTLRSDRPLLAGLDERARLERIRSLLAERIAIYSSADIEQSTEGLTPDQVEEAVLEKVTKWKESHSS